MALYLKEALPLAASDVVSGSVSFCRSPDYKRAYEVALTYELNGKRVGTQLWSMR